MLVTKPAPDFKAQAVMHDNSFKEISLSDYKGKKVVGQDLVDELRLIDFVKGKSSTKTIEKIKNGK